MKKQKISNKKSLFKKVENFIISKINSQLANHGGLVSLIDITHDGYVILQFSGGCNGCSMANITLKTIIEKQLLKLFPIELKGVKDITEHKHGIHSYF